MTAMATAATIVATVASVTAVAGVRTVAGEQQQPLALGWVAKYQQVLLDLGWIAAYGLVAWYRVSGLARSDCQAKRTGSPEEKRQMITPFHGKDLPYPSERTARLRQVGPAEAKKPAQ